MSSPDHDSDYTTFGTLRVKLSPDRPARLDLGRTSRNNPWPGLRAYEEDEQDFFYGRGTASAELLRLIKRNALTVFYGVSGLGKSSILSAGLFPRLREEEFLPLRIRLDFADREHSLTDLAPLREELQRKGVQEDPLADPCPSGQGETLWEYFHRVRFWNRGTMVIPVLVFDQFEEVFTHGAEPAVAADTAAFLSELADLIDNQLPPGVRERIERTHQPLGFPGEEQSYRIVLTLREDYLANLERLVPLIRSLTNRSNSLALRPMSGEEAIEAVRKPGGDLVDEEVARKIVSVVGQQRRRDFQSEADAWALEVEPFLLSLICRELNAKRLARGLGQITADLVEQSRTGILVDFYESCFSGVAPEVRRFVEDELIGRTGYRESVAVQRALDFPGVTREAIDNLVAHRLLRIEDRHRVPRLELTHDVLTPIAAASRDKRAEDARLSMEREKRERAEQEAVVVRRRLRRVRRLRRAADEAAQQARRALARVELREAERLLEENAAAALAHGANALRGYPDDVAARTLVASIVSYRNWALPTAILPRKDFQSAKFNADGTRIVTISADHVVRIWDSPRGCEVGPSFRHEDRVRSVELSLDGTTILTASDDKTARIWDVRTGVAKRTMVEEVPVRSGSLSRNGELAVIVSDDRGATVFDTRHCAFANRLDHEAQAAVMSPDGSRVVTASHDGTARVWNAQNGRSVGKVMRHEASVWSAVFSPDGTRVVTASWDGTARIWNARTGAPLTEPMQHDAAVWSASFSTDGSHVVTASADGTARIWDADTGVARCGSLQHDGRVLSALFATDGKRVITASEDGTARIWDAVTGALWCEPLRHTTRVIAASFSSDATHAVTCSADGQTRIWDVRAKAAVGVPLRHQGRVLSASFSSDSTRVVTASDDCTARIWDARSGTAITEPLRHQAKVSSASFSADGSLVVTASDDHAARIWHARTGTAVRTPLTHPHRVLSACFNPDASRLLTVSYDGAARIWNLHTWSIIGEPLRDEAWILAASFSEDGTHVITASEAGTVHLWEACTGRSTGKVFRHKAPVLAASLRHDGKWLATGSADGLVRIWNADTGEPIGEPFQHGHKVWSARFSPDGSRTLTASEDGTARVWDVRTGAAVGEPLRHRDGVKSALFSADGLRVVTASQDGTARVWDARTGAVIAETLRHENSIHGAAFNSEGTRLVTASSDETARLWDLITGSPADAELLASLAEAVGGYRINDLGALVPLDDQVERLDELHTKASVADAVTQDPTMAAFLQWFFDDLETRTVSPLSDMWQEEYRKRTDQTADR